MDGCRALISLTPSVTCGEIVRINGRGRADVDLAKSTHFGRVRVYAGAGKTYLRSVT